MTRERFEGTKPHVNMRMAGRIDHGKMTLIVMDTGLRFAIREGARTVDVGILTEIEK